MYSEKLEELISAALADGNLTELKFPTPIL
jgi:hypothetical protein